MAKTVDRARDRVSDARPLVERALKDEELRNHVRDAFWAAREAYGELFGKTGMTGVAVRAATDKEIQDNLKRAVDELRHAADRIQGKSSHTARNAMLLMVGVAIGLLANPMTGPGSRRWIKGRLFGDSDEFGYGGSNSSTFSNGA